MKDTNVDWEKKYLQLAHRVSDLIYWIENMRGVYDLQHFIHSKTEWGDKVDSETRKKRMRTYKDMLTTFNLTLIKMGELDLLNYYGLDTEDEKGE